MAEKSSPKKVFVENNQEHIECAVCLQTCVYPTVLPCGHVFCFLCVKGLDRTTGICAMCRQQFPSDFLDKPSLLRPVDANPDSGFDDGQQWYYEGRHGWWQYDERTSECIEVAFKRGDKNCEVSIAGTIYVVDFEKMEQRQKLRSGRTRRIKRDFVSIEKKGISGIRATVETSSNEDDTLSCLSRLNLGVP